MTSYRILEKEGTRKENDKTICPHEQCGNGCTYIPRFIVQGFDAGSIGGHVFGKPRQASWISFQEFTSLEEARKFKRSLELKEGIVRE